MRPHHVADVGFRGCGFHRGRCVHGGDGGDVIVNRLAPPVAGIPLSGINLPVYPGRLVDFLVFFNQLFFPQRLIKIGEMGERDDGTRVGNQLCALDHDRLCGGESNSSRSVFD